MVQSRAGGETVQIALRLPSDLRDRLKFAADGSGRSVNSEIVAALEKAYPDPNQNLREVLHKFFNVIALSPHSQREALFEEMKGLGGLMGDLASRAEFDASLHEAIRIVEKFEQDLGHPIRPEDIDEVWRRAFPRTQGDPTKEAIAKRKRDKNELEQKISELLPGSRKPLADDE